MLNREQHPYNVGDTYRFKGASPAREYGNWIVTRKDSDFVYAMCGGRETTFIHLNTPVDRGEYAVLLVSEAKPDETEAYFV